MQTCFLKWSARFFWFSWHLTHLAEHGGGLTVSRSIEITFTRLFPVLGPFSGEF